MTKMQLSRARFVLMLALALLLQVGRPGQVHAASDARCGTQATLHWLADALMNGLTQVVPFDQTDLRKHFQDLDPQFLHIVTTAYDDKVQHYECTGTLTVTVPDELYKMSVDATANYRNDLTGSIMNDVMGKAALRQGQISNDAHVMRMLMVEIGNYDSATFGAPISYRSVMTDDGDEHFVHMDHMTPWLLAPVLAIKMWQENPQTARDVHKAVLAEAEQYRRQAAHFGLIPR